MRRAVTPTPGNRAASLPISLPAPVGGLNTRDGRAVMPITDAELMDNWYPEATDVRARAGSQTYASGLGAQVESILSYTSGQTLKLLVACGGSVINITTVQTDGTVAAGRTVANNFTNDRWQYRNFGTQGGGFIVAVNGSDARQIYNGSIMFAGSASSGAGTSAIFTNIEVFQHRLFYTQNSLQFLYQDQVNAIGGTISGFDLTSMLKKGGYLQAIGTWTRDGGAGMDDVIAFISSMGQVAVYQGTDPGNANSWSRIGVYDIARPVSNRCVDKVGGELIIWTVAGAIPISGVLSGLVQQETTYTDKITTSLADAWTIYKNNFGWMMKYAEDLGWLILNVPVATGNFQEQYVMNVHTRAWCRFKSLTANCWETHNGTLYYGGDGKVVEVSTTFQSDDGNDIQLDVRQAASSFGAPGRLKHFKTYRPLINSDGALGLAFGFNVDFDDRIPTNIPAITSVAFAEWDVATWDDFFWGGDPIPVGQVQSAGAFGTYGSVRIKGAVNETAVRWYGTDVVLEPGGMI
jgi:hypothetical protein